jgi:hypothetical protein
MHQTEYDEPTAGRCGFVSRYRCSNFLVRRTGSVSKVKLFRYRHAGDNGRGLILDLGTRWG